MSNNNQKRDYNIERLKKERKPTPSMIKNFERDLLSILGDVAGISWGRGIKRTHQITSDSQPDKKTFEKLWWHDFGIKEAEMRSDKSSMRVAAPPGSMISGFEGLNESESKNWITVSDIHSYYSMYTTKDGKLIDGTIESIGFGLLPKEILPPNRPLHLVQIFGNTLGFQSFSVPPKENKLHKTVGHKIKARLYDMEALLGVYEDMEYAERDGAYVRPTGYSKGSHMKDNWSVFKKDLPIKGHSRVPKEGGKSYSDPADPHKLLYETVWQESPEENWITQGRICHVCLNMTKPEEGDDYSRIPICQACNRLYPSGVSAAEANILGTSNPLQEGQVGFYEKGSVGPARKSQTSKGEK